MWILASQALAGLLWACLLVSPCTTDQHMPSHVGAADPQTAAAEWRSSPAVQQQGLLVGVFPAGECLVGELPNCGPLSYAMCCLRAYTQLMKMVRGGLCTKVSARLGVLQVCAALRLCALPACCSG